ncbi:MAG TPA: hypothetical protein VJZ68_03575 [Nitrososphaera sp.]|nr:hypothetical protein [Nitrososphaera sp.]
MRIAHINNISGVSSIIAEEQLKQGHSADVFVFNRTSHSQFGGIKLNYKSPFTMWRFLKRLGREYDVWHYHYPYGSLKKSLEMLLRKSKKHKAYLKHYHGDDLRDKFDEDFCLVSTPDLLKFAPNGKWLPNPIETSKIKNIVKKKVESYPLKIAHYPHYASMKKYADKYREVARSLGQLEDEGKCKVVTIANVPHDAALRSIADCDIVLGKLDLGWFGKFELEGMALGKPIVCNVAEELYGKYHPPIYRSTITTFERDLRRLLDDEHTRSQLSSQGTEYVTKNHSPDVVCNILLTYYAQASST